MEVDTVPPHHFDHPPPASPPPSPPHAFLSSLESAMAVDLHGAPASPGVCHGLPPMVDGDSLPPLEPSPLSTSSSEARCGFHSTAADASFPSPIPPQPSPSSLGAQSGFELTARDASLSSPKPPRSPAGFGPPAAGYVNEPVPGSPIPDRSVETAVTKVQKVYRSYRTRRRLADSAVVAEELWWQAIDFIRLNQSTVSFFDDMKHETAISRWNRVSLNASKVGRGLSKDAKALKLAFQHWIEAIDPRHRYGHNLHYYYDAWCKSQDGQPFFYWLDIGNGREVDLKECSRSKLRKQCIRYLGPRERKHYEYVPVEGKIVHKQTGELLDTGKGPDGAKWIFVMSTSKKLYAGEKIKGFFHHSSFLAGGATIAAGRFAAENGVLKRIWAYSGHYRPTEENLNNFVSFLRENGVDLNDAQISSSSNEEYYDDSPQLELEKTTETRALDDRPQLSLPAEVVLNAEATGAVANSQSEGSVEVGGQRYKRTLSGGLQSPRADVPQNAILERIKSKRERSSYQLGHQLSSKWCSGAGPRIGCVADYPLEVRQQALEFVNLSPRAPASPASAASRESFVSHLITTSDY